MEGELRMKGGWKVGGRWYLIQRWMEGEGVGSRDRRARMVQDAKIVGRRGDEAYFGGM